MALKRRVAPGIYRAGRNRWRIVVEGVRNPATGKRRQIVRIFHGNLREAEEFQSSIKLAEGRFLGHSRDETSVGQLIQLWLSQKQHASTTRDDIERVIRLHISDNVKNMKVSSLTTRHVDMLYGSLLSDGVSAHRIKRVHDVLRAAFEQAVVWDLVARNPVDRARRPPVPKPHPTAPEASEVQKILEAALRDPDDYWFYVFLVVSISMGMRRGEEPVRAGRADHDLGSAPWSTCSITVRVVAESAGCPRMARRCNGLTIVCHSTSGSTSDRIVPAAWAASMTSAANW